MSSHTLVRHPESLAIATLPPDAPEPEWLSGNTFVATIRTARELVVVSRATTVPEDVTTHGPFIAFELARDLEPSEPGPLAMLAAAPNRAGISVLPYTTFDRGWLLVHRADASRLQALWEADGLTVITPEERG